MRGVVEYTSAVLESLKPIVGGIRECEVEAVVEELLRVKIEGKKVYVTGAGRANLIMRTFAMRLMQIGFQSYMVFDTTTPAMGPGDLLIAGSGSGTTETVVAIARQAKRLGARLVLFSKRQDGFLASEADMVVQIPTELCKVKLQTRGSEFEQTLLLLCDNIGVELMKRLECIHNIDQIDDFIRIRHANLQ